ncbi:MAG: hypothetical protein P1T08_18830, partial [Acidimicrobiia bacterium]|nr:hypothetical protein [Acidimicrobiia bacterium]
DSPIPPSQHSDTPTRPVSRNVDTEGSLPVGGKTIQLSTYLTPDDYSSQPALMFLRWTGQSYEDGWGKTTPEAIEAWDRAGYCLVSSQGLFVNALIGAWNPISSEHEGYLEEAPMILADPVAQQVRHLSLDELVSLVKSLR